MKNFYSRDNSTRGVLYVYFGFPLPRRFYPFVFNDKGAAEAVDTRHEIDD